MSPNRDRDGSSSPPVRIYTLGRLSLERAEFPDARTFQIRPKPLQLLKLMIALGGQGIHSDKASETLWPEAEGDKAAHSLTMNLKRLREDLGADIGHQAVSLQGGRLILDSTLVWCDALAFSEAAEYALRHLAREGQGEAWQRLEQALELYKGPFLEGEDDPPEVMTARERLHLKYLGLVEFAGGHCQENGDTAKAVLLYQRGLEVDDVYERFYQALIRCLMEMGRTPEALAAYQRCRKILQSSYGSEPSEDTEALHRALLAQAAAGNSGKAAAAPPAAAQPVAPPPDRRAASPGATAAPGATPAPGKSPPRTRLGLIARRRLARRRLRLALAGALALAGLLAVWAGWRGYRVLILEPVALKQLKAEAADPLPDKPSIAVLPFASRDEAAGQALFADAFTENIIVQLARAPGLFVISPATSFGYRKRAVNARQVGRELGVANVLEGTVQKLLERVRITVTLSAAATGESLWAEVYDWPLKDAARLQDEITHKIVTSLNVVLKEGEQARIWQESAHDYRAWEFTYQGLEFLRKMDHEENLRAQAMFKKSLKIDPNYATAHAGLGFAYFLEARFGWTHDPRGRIAEAMRLAQKGIELDENLGESYALLGATYLLLREHDKAIQYGRQAVDRQPNGAEMNALLAQTPNFAGHGDEALLAIDKALRLSPSHPNWYDFQQGLSYYLLGRHDQAIEVLNGYLKRMPFSTESPIFLISSHLQRGNRREALRLANVLRSSNPSVSITEYVRELMPLRDEKVRQRLLEHLRAVGF